MIGRFITLEGIDGCGKSTQLAMLADALRARGNQIIVTRERQRRSMRQEISRRLV